MAAYPSDYPVLVRVQPPPDAKPPLAAADQADQAVQDDVVYYAPRPLWLAVQAVGFYPMHRQCRGGQPKGASLWLAQLAQLALGALQYAAVLAVMVLAFVAAQHRDEEQDFDGSIIKYLVYIQCVVPAVLLPLYALQRVPLTEYLRDWNRFQVEFAGRSGRSLSTLRAFSCRDSLEVLAVVALWEAVVAACQLPLHPPVVVLALVLSNAVSALLASLWYVHGRLLRAAAHASAAHLGRVLARRAPGAAEVDACRLQTLRLMSLSTALGSAMTLCLGFLLLAHFVLLTLTLYALFGQLSHSTRSAARLPSLVAGVVFSGAVLYVVCNSGHCVARALKTDAMLEIMAFRRRTPMVGDDLHNMIEAFVATVQEVPSEVSLSGITVVNRQLFTAVLSTMVTYLVVVVQFRVSLEAKDAADATTASSFMSTGAASVAANMTVSATSVEAVVTEAP